MATKVVAPPKEHGKSPSTAGMATAWRGTEDLFVDSSESWASLGIEPLTRDSRASSSVNSTTRY